MRPILPEVPPTLLAAMSLATGLVVTLPLSAAGRAEVLLPPPGKRMHVATNHEPREHVDVTVDSSPGALRAYRALVSGPRWTSAALFGSR